MAADKRKQPRCCARTHLQLALLIQAPLPLRQRAQRARQVLALALQPPRLRLVFRHLRARRFDHARRLLARRHLGGGLAHERHGLADVLLQRAELLGARGELAHARIRRGGARTLALHRRAHLRQRALRALRGRGSASGAVRVKEKCCAAVSPCTHTRKQRTPRRQGHAAWRRTSGASTILARSAAPSSRAACAACFAAAALSARSCPSAFRSRIVACSASCSSASAFRDASSVAFSAASAATRCGEGEGEGARRVWLSVSGA
jgi:hypothetical protein